MITDEDREHLPLVVRVFTWAILVMFNRILELLTHVAVRVGLSAIIPLLLRGVLLTDGEERADMCLPGVP